MLDKHLLVEALAGRISLEEYNTLGSAGAGGSVGPHNPAMSSRAEQLDVTWRDIITKMEALWSIDIMNAAPDVYDKAAGALDEIRNLGPSACRAAANNFKQITTILKQAAGGDEFADEKDLKLFMARQEELNAELEYICDEFDPNVPRPPEQPTRTREQWLKAKSKDRKKGIEPPENSEVGSDLGFDNAKPASDVPPERTFVPDRSAVGKGQASGTPEKKESPKSTPKAKEVSSKTSPKPGQTGSQSNKQSKTGKEVKPKKGAAEKPAVIKKPEKKIKESQADACPSVVMASLAEAAESATDKEAVFLQAGDAIRACLEAYTDVGSAYVEIGQAIPGGNPRLDLYTEWAVRGRPSECHGYARLHLDENEGLVVMDSSDCTRDVIRFDESESDEVIAWRVYHALDAVYDTSPRTTWKETRVVPILHRLLERYQRGGLVTGEMLREALSGLVGSVALHEAVIRPSTSISVVQESGFEDIYAYHYAWTVNTPLGHTQLPDEISPHQGTMDDPPTTDEEADEQLARNDHYLASAPIKDAGEDYQDAHWQFALFGEAVDELLQDPDLDEKYREYLQSKKARTEGAHRAYWRTPTLSINLAEGSVKIRHRDGTEEEISPDTKDEDITAKLATYAFQKENIETAKLIEYFERERISLDPVQGQRGTYIARYRGKILGSVNSNRRMWGISVRKNGPWKNYSYPSAYAAAQALAKSQGIHEQKRSNSRLIRKLSNMETDELYAVAQMLGVKVRGDGVTFDRAKLQTHILAASSGGDPNNLPAQVGFQENCSPEAVVLSMCEAAEMKMDRMTALSWVKRHCKEYL